MFYINFNSLFERANIANQFDMKQIFCTTCFELRTRLHHKRLATTAVVLSFLLDIKCTYNTKISTLCKIQKLIFLLFLIILICNISTGYALDNTNNNPTNNKQPIINKNPFEIKLDNKIKLIQIYYAKAKDIANILTKNKKTLFPNIGEVAFDERSNQLIINSSETNFIKIKNLIKQLDHPEKQILIEARIVEISQSAFKELGVDFNLTSNLNKNSPINNSISALGAADFIPKAFIHNGLVNPNSSIGFVIKNLSNHLLLDLELQALQSEGRAKIISKPHLIVTEHDIAHIQQGQEIPYQSRVSSGVTSIQFKKALLKLEVTPSITPNNKIILNLNINKDQIKPGESLADNIPLIDTRQIKTKIRVNNNQTVLLGGIIEEQEISDKKLYRFYIIYPELENYLKALSTLLIKMRLLFLLRLRY